MMAMRTMIKTGVVGSLALSTVAAVNSHADTMANREYLSDLYFLTMKQEAQDLDIQDANYLQGAGVNALNGGVIAPRDWREVPVVSATPEELERARVKLQYAINSGAVNQMPREFSQALVAYDCWVGQQKAQPNASHNLASCRERYYTYAQYLPTPTKEITTEVPMVMKELHKVYFAWDSYALTADARSKLDEARDMLMDARNGRLVIGGYADASGPRAYNRELSRKRAQAVANYLGLDRSRYEIDLNAYGEENLQVPTADGVKEARNRVAIIGIRVAKDVKMKKTVTY